MMNVGPRLDRAALAEPYELYAELRREGVVREARHGRWLVSSHAHVRDVLRRTDVFSSEVGALAHLRGTPTAAMMIAADDPRHARLRSVVADAFHVHRTASWRSTISSIATELITEMVRVERCDAVRSFTVPLPVTVIAVLLGVPTADQAAFGSWSHDFIDGLARPDWETAIAPAWAQLCEYLAHALDDRRRQPGDDLISSIAAAASGSEPTLSHDEAVDLCVLLLVAGNETTTNLLANALHILAGQAELQHSLRGDPAGIRPFIEETLRFDGPVQGLIRVCTRDVELGGAKMCAGDEVVVLFASANRDETAFTDAGQFSLAARDAPHFGFGFGLHHCLGAPLARLEAEVAIDHLLRATRRILLDPARSPVRAVSLVTRGFCELALILEPSTQDGAR